MRPLALPAGAARFVAGGGRDVAADQLGVALAPGEHLRLVDNAGDELGLGVADPDNALVRVLATPADGLPAIDGALLGVRVERALAWRTRLGLPGADRAYRLIHGAGDGLAGFACDVLGRVAVVYAYGAGLLALARQLAEAVVGFARLDGAVVKLRSGKDDAAIDRDVVGTVAERALAREHGVAYEVHPRGALNTGLFTDLRVARRDLAELAAGLRVLNLFSYTGALGLACARGGAAAVTSVDTSDGVQAWARGNFARAGLGGDAWRFETGDAVRFLARAARDRERYDLVIVDPPTFSTARGAPWSLPRDYPALIAQAAAVIPDGGLLWLAANAHGLGSLAKLALAGLRTAGKTAAIAVQAGLPPEYPTVAAQPGDRYLQICMLRLG
ncbi:MAG TPA: class I SAM-dependent methyltransferase [Kofleriaceae bacterium]|nr:class I SAM-dependent methyltransferase [Kofleriaceae bacterium]